MTVYYGGIAMSVQYWNYDGFGLWLSERGDTTLRIYSGWQLHFKQHSEPRERRNHDEPGHGFSRAKSNQAATKSTRDLMTSQDFLEQVGKVVASRHE